jgi:hypothetical protein
MPGRKANSSKFLGGGEKLKLRYNELRRFQKYGIYGRKIVDGGRPQPLNFYNGEFVEYVDLRDIDEGIVLKFEEAQGFRDFGNPQFFYIQADPDAIFYPDIR